MFFFALKRRMYPKEGMFEKTGFVHMDIQPSSAGMRRGIYGFYSLDGKQYAIGEAIWISNELQALALVRP